MTGCTEARATTSSGRRTRRATICSAGLGSTAAATTSAATRPSRSSATNPSKLDVALRLSTGRGAELGELRACALGHDEVLLALVAFERLLESCGGLLAAASERERLCELGVGVGLGVQHLRLVPDRDCVPCQPFRLGIVAAAGEDLRPDL